MLVGGGGNAVVLVVALDNGGGVSSAMLALVLVLIELVIGGAPTVWALGLPIVLTAEKLDWLGLQYGAVLEW